MGVARPILGLVAIVLLAGGIVMQLLIILSGLSGSPENFIYFLSADTSAVTSGTLQLNQARWTYLRLCGTDTATNRNANCLGTTAALPFDPVAQFGTQDGLPAAFQNHTHYYYISRFAWVFYLIALFFSVVALFTSLAALFARLGAYLTGFTTLLAVFFQALAASLMTAWVVQGVKAFQNNAQAANIGIYAMAFSWATFAAWFLAALFFCIGGSVSKSSSSSSGQKSSYFGRKRSTRSRGSFIESETGGRRVIKEEYE